MDELDVKNLATAIAKELYENGVAITTEYREVVMERNSAYAQLGLAGQQLVVSNRLVERLLVLASSLRNIDYDRGSTAWVMCDEELKVIDAEYKAIASKQDNVREAE